MIYARMNSRCKESGMTKSYLMDALAKKHHLADKKKAKCSSAIKRLLPILNQ